MESILLKPLYLKFGHIWFLFAIGLKCLKYHWKILISFSISRGLRVASVDSELTRLGRFATFDGPERVSCHVQSDGFVKGLKAKVLHGIQLPKPIRSENMPKTYPQHSNPIAWKVQRYGLFRCQGDVNDISTFGSWTQFHWVKRQKMAKDAKGTPKLQSRNRLTSNRHVLKSLFHI